MLYRLAPWTGVIIHLVMLGLVVSAVTHALVTHG